MSTEIKAIQKDTIHKICSGQVVLNLATAIKELVENSLDAKATIIDVRLKEFGSELIEVIDNGTGIHPNNFQSLGQKHHTSKLINFSDLIDVETFGFRGEALSSLCAVSDVTIVTRHENEKHGSKLAFDSLGVLQSREPYARQIGTTLSLANLFSSLPVRQREFHRNLKKEFNKAVQILSGYCLITINVKITCINRMKKNGKTTFLSTQGNKTIRDNISCVFGSKQLSTLLEIADSTPTEEILSEFGIKNYISDLFFLQGYISSCEHGLGRSSSDRQFYFVNGRPCEPSKVMKLVNEVYRQYNQHQFPFVLLNILISKEMVDVNVTPDKRLLFVQNENLLLACVKSSLLRLFENIPSRYKVDNSFSDLKTSKHQLPEPPKFTLSTLDKWRCTKDTTVVAGTSTDAGTVGQKRSYDGFDRKTAGKPKQMKLNFDAKSCSNAKLITKCGSSNDDCKYNHANETDESVTETDIIVETTTDTVAMTVIAESQPLFDHIAGSEPVLSYVPNSGNDEVFDTDHLVEENLGISSDSENDIVDQQVTISATKVDNKRDSTPVMKSIQLGICQSESLVSHYSTRRRVFLDVSSLDIRRILQENKIISKRNNVISNKFYADIDPNKNEIAEEELSRAISKDMFRKMKIIGQFNMGFIITKLENDLFIVDQHATDEKYNFETLQRTTTLNCQKLVIPQDLELTVTNECLLIDNIDIFRRNGFEFLVDLTAEATKRVKLVSIPTSRNWRLGKEDIDEMLFMLQDAPNTMCRPSRVKAMFASRACRKSVMIGTPLNVTDMKRLIGHMSEIEHPWNCPHGRPTMRHLINLSLLS